MKTVVRTAIMTPKTTMRLSGGHDYAKGEPVDEQALIVRFNRAMRRPWSPSSRTINAQCIT